MKALPGDEECGFEGSHDRRDRSTDARRLAAAIDAATDGGDWDETGTRRGGRIRPLVEAGTAPGIADVQRR